MLTSNITIVRVISVHRERVPPVVDLMKVWPLLDSYDSFDQYVEIVKPLLLLETWQSVSLAALQLCNTHSHSLPLICNVFVICILIGCH